MRDDAEPPAIVAGVELGGTKVIAVVGHGRTLLDRVTLPTGTPGETLGALAATLARWREVHRPVALGIAAFGPVAVDRADPAWGHVLATPKAGWAGADVVGALAAALPGPVMVQTDVTAAALAEGRWGAGRGLADFVYVTLGTGVGMGVIAGGRPVMGALHPEAGHLRVRRVAGDGFAGTCPYHGDCLEGLASGPAIARRTGVTGDRLDPTNPAWGLVADAIAEGFASLLLTLASRAILVGGGIGVGQPRLLAMVRPLVVAKLAGYLPFVDGMTVAHLIRPAALGADAGPLGALVLAGMAAAEGG